MNETEKHASLAIDSLTALEESMEDCVGWHPKYPEWLGQMRDVKGHLEEMAVPRKSTIRTWIQRIREAA